MTLPPAPIPKSAVLGPQRISHARSAPDANSSLVFGLMSCVYINGTERDASIVIDNESHTAFTVPCTASGGFSASRVASVWARSHSFSRVVTSVTKPMLNAFAALSLSSLPNSAMRITSPNGMRRSNAAGSSADAIP